ncbi:MAG: hypothetical protein E7396_02255 [Ruminococcaceae bacterium]|nr:hypothetical protein [Oscillospiraceae bacterium]
MKNIEYKSILPKRQVHLDFHTSPLIDGIGENFDGETFADTLKKADVESITIFAKCHHGYCYYPTKVGTMHPGLKFDLTGAMIEACHKYGLRAPVYITAGRSILDIERHPEYLAKNKDGSYKNNLYQDIHNDDEPIPEGAWQHLCMSNPHYLKEIYDITEEVCQRYEMLDGLFYDICFVGGPCYCDECIKGMKERGLDPENDEDAQKYYDDTHYEFMIKIRQILDKNNPDATLFFNSGGANIYAPHILPYETHYEIEDLPTAWGGYDKMALNAKYFENTDSFYMGMTGKFHTDWGEFGGFKTKEALKAEAASMAMYGAAISVGDQMHPDGALDKETYENIGYAFSYYKKLEEFSFGGKNMANIGLYLSSNRNANTGVSNILLENQLDFCIVKDGNFHQFDLVIFPDGVVLNDEEVDKLNEYINSGKKVIISGHSLIKDNRFQIDTGLEFVSEPTFDKDYILMMNPSENIPKTPFLIYNPGNIVRSIDADILAECVPPYFSRTYGHYCSHRNTPYDKDATRYPAMTKKGNIVYMANDIATSYKNAGCVFHKNYFIKALEILGFEPTVETNMYSQGRVSLIRQPHKNRYVLNLLYVSPVKRGKYEIIEDICPIYDIDVKINVNEKITKLYDGLTNEEIPYDIHKGYITFKVDKLHCHKVIVAEY